MITCPKCEGKTWRIDTGPCDNIEDYMVETCAFCSGTGRVTLLRWILAKIGVTHVL